MTENTAPSPDLERRRFPTLVRESMTERQRAVADEFLGFSLNGMQGPFVMMLRSPEAAARFQALGGYLRFNTGLSNRVIELAVLVHARLWNDQYEWSLHAPRAAAAGLSEATIEAIRGGLIPAGLTAEEETVFRFCVELERDRRVCGLTFGRALLQLGEQRITDLTFLLGQYATISMILAVAEEGKAIDELPACDRPFNDYAAQEGLSL